MTSLDLKVPPVALSLATAALMWAIARACPNLGVAVPGRIGLAWCLAIAGAAIAVAGVAAFRRARTTTNPMTPDASAAVVDSGIYRVSRNPMYVGFALVLAGWATYLGNVLSVALLPAFVLYLNRFQIAPEEQALTAKFGASYLDYTRRVRRWL